MRLLTAFLISILISGIVLFCHHEPINIDGMLYLLVAKTYLHEGLAQAKLLYPWPFYSLCIAWMHELTHLNLLSSAYVINTFFISIAVVAYLLILNECGVTRTVFWCGLVIILLFTELNKHRIFIIRDPVYWALMLLACWQLLCYLRDPAWWRAWSVSVLLMIGTLFRIEGAILCVFVPFFLLLQNTVSWPKRMWQVMQVGSLIWLAVLGMVLWLFLGHHQAASQLGRLNQVVSEFHDGIVMSVTRFTQTAQQLQQTILANSIGESAGVFLFAGLIGFLVNNIVSTVGIFYLVLVLYAWMHLSLPLEADRKKVLAAIIALNFLIPIIFLSQDYFLASRYLMPGVFLVLLWAPLTLNHWFSIGSRWWRYLVVIILAVMSYFVVMPAGVSKAYLRNGGDWLAQHAGAAPIYSNSPEVLFYTNHWREARAVFNPMPLKTRDFHGYDWLAIRVDHNANTTFKQMVAQLPYKPVKVFANKRSDKVMIYYVSH